MPYREASVMCPSCTKKLDWDEGAELRSAACEGCGGVWMAHDTFLEAMHRHQPALRLTELLVHNDGTPRRPCAACGEDMDIAWIDFLQLDQCQAHGIWFDAGELGKALGGNVVPAAVEQVLKRADERKKQRESKHGYIAPPS